MKQPEALRLADALNASNSNGKMCDEAAAELRRLHEENTALRQAIEQAEKQEPVAWMTYKGYLYHASDPKVLEHSDPTPLYDKPPKRQWEGLTHGELAECQSDNIYQFYRGIEQRLKEKNR